MTQRWKLTVEYDGTDFAGWQRQENAVGVQNVLEDAIHKFSGETVTLHVAGRTDAGVHALGQVAHVDLEKDTDEKTVRDAVNFHARPHAVSIVAAERVDDAFHARFSALKRVYCYKLLTGRRAAPAIGGRYVWHTGHDLDVTAMNAGARHLLGLHDFTSFRDTDCQAKHPMRSIDRIDFIERQDTPMFGRHIEMWVEARSFLHHQVRNMMGTLALVGLGKWQPDDVKSVLEARDRTKAGPTAPAGGLYFVRVDYDAVGSPFQRGIDSLI